MVNASEGEMSEGAKEYLRKMKRKRARLKAEEKAWHKLSVKQQVKILRRYQHMLWLENKKEKTRQRGCPYSGPRWY